MVVEYIRNMGICVPKETSKTMNQPLVPSSFYRSIKPQRLHDLIEQRKAKAAPLLSLANNPLYLKRRAACKDVNSRRVPVECQGRQSKGVM